MRKKALIAVLLIAVAVSVSATLLWPWLTQGKYTITPDLPDYSEGISLRITGEAADALETAEVFKLEELAEAVGRILYNVDDSYPPDNPAQYLSGTNSQDLLSLASAYRVKSRMLESIVLDIRMEEMEAGDLLVCYRLDYESSQKEKGEYLFLLNLRVSRAGDGWICDEATSRGSVPAAEYALSRDDLTGNIRLKPQIEE